MSSLTIKFGESVSIKGNTENANKVQCTQKITSNDSHYCTDYLITNKGETSVVTYPHPVGIYRHISCIISGSMYHQKVTNVVALVQNTIVEDGGMINMEKVRQLPTFLLIDKSSKVSPTAKLIGFDHVIYFDENNIDTLVSTYGAPITPYVISKLKEFL